MSRRDPSAPSHRPQPPCTRIAFFPSIFQPCTAKKVKAAFDGGSISLDGCLLVLREAERRLGVSALLAKCIRDRRDRAQISHQVDEMLLFRMLANAWAMKTLTAAMLLVATLCSSWPLAVRRKAVRPCARNRRFAGWRTCRRKSKPHG